MPSKIPYINKEISLQIMRSVGWISIVYLLGLLFVLPIQIIMKYSEYQKGILKHINVRDMYHVETLFEYQGEIQFVLLIAIPVLTAVFLFRFLHVKQAADLMHSIPIKREKIFHHYAIGGALLQIVPIAMISLFVFVLHTSLDLDVFFSKGDIFTWAGTTLLLNLVFYFAGIFVGMMTGISAVQAVLTYIFLLFPSGIMVLLNYNLRNLFYGFPADYYFNYQKNFFSPLMVAADLPTKPFRWMDTITYVFIVLVLYGLALFFYKKRSIEAAGEAIAFPKLRVVFKYGVTFCTMLLAGMYFDQSQAYGTGWKVFGYIAGAVIGYFLAEMVLQKTWRVFTKLKGLVIYGVSIVLLLVVVQPIGSFFNKVPEQKEIKSVLIADHISAFMNQNDRYQYDYLPSPMKEQENIELVRKLHNEIIHDQQLNERDGLYYTIHLKYNLKNGGHIVRQYRVDQPMYEDYFSAIYATKEYRETTNEIFRIKVKKIDQITVSPNAPTSGKVIISNEKDIRDVVAAIKKDILLESYEDERYFESRGSSIEIQMSDGYVFNLMLKPSYLSLTKWLKEHDLLERAKVTSADISHLYVAKRNGADFSEEISIAQIKNDPKSLKITDKAVIDECLDRFGFGENAEYTLLLYFIESDGPEIYYFDDKHVPDIVKEHFQQAGSTGNGKR